MYRERRWRRDDPRPAVKIEANGGTPSWRQIRGEERGGGCTPPGVEIERIAGEGGYNPPCWFENEANEGGGEESLLLSRNRRDVGWTHPSSQGVGVTGLPPSKSRVYEEGGRYSSSDLVFLLKTDEGEDG